MSATVPRPRECRYGRCRHGAIEDVLARFIAKPPRNAGSLLPVLEIAVAQLLFMGIVDHAAVSVAVDQVSARPRPRHFGRHWR